MSQQSTPPNPPPQPTEVPEFYPGHVMARLHYEALAREAAGQK